VETIRAVAVGCGVLAEPGDGHDAAVHLVDADLVPSGTTLVTGGATDTRVVQVLPDGRLYAEGETYDNLIELSEALGVSGNPWSTWAAELT
jgi:hypothetical protein